MTDRGWFSGRAEVAGLGVVLALFALTHLQGIGEAFLYGHQGFNNSLRSIIGRNYVRHGVVELGGKPIKNIGPVQDPKDHVVHWHHPPLVHMLVGLAFAVFGESEASARAVPIFFSLISVLLLWRLARRRLGPAGGLWAAAIFTLMPLEVEYGKMANYEAPVIALMLGALLAAVRIREADGANGTTGTRLAVAALFGCTAAAGFTDWPAFILAAFIGLVLLLERPRRWALFLTYGAFCALWLFLLWKWMNHFADSDGLYGLARWRAGGGSAKVATGAWLDRTWARLLDYVGAPVLAAVAAGVVAFAVRFRRLPVEAGVFGLGGLLYLYLFKYGSWVHVFFLSYLLPAFAVLAAAGLVLSWRAGARLEPVLKARLATGLANLAGRWRRAAGLAARMRDCRPAGLWARPVLTSGVLALWGLWAVPTEWRLLDKAKLVSHGVRTDLGRPRAGLPYDGRLDVVLLGKTARKMSRPGDLVAVHRRTHSSPQFRWYLARNSRVISSVAQVRGERLFIVPERLLTDEQKRAFVRDHFVVSLLRYWIVDLKAKKPGLRHLEYVEYPASWRHTFFTSMFYPPHALVERRAKGEAIRRALEAPPAAPTVVPGSDEPPEFQEE